MNQLLCRKEARDRMMGHTEERVATGHARDI